MTTETLAPDITFAPEEFQPPIEIPRGERAREVTFLGLRRGRTNAYDALFKKECPKVLAGSLTDERLLELGIEGVNPDHYIRDPDVIWLGRLIDGLTYLGVFNSRSLGKQALQTVRSGKEFRPPNGAPGILRGGGDVACRIIPVFRQEMLESYDAGKWDRMDRKVLEKIKNFESPVIDLGEPIIDNEPGEVRNSPDFDLNSKLSDEELDDMWAAQMASEEWIPQMRRDTRYGLHYLKRGDRIEINIEGWPKPGTPYTEHVWELRPPSEGSSHIDSSTGETGVVSLT